MESEKEKDKNSEKQLKQGNFVDTNEQDIELLLEGSKAKNTNRSTQSSLTRFREFLQHSKLPDLDDLNIDKLPKILTNFYMSVHTNKTRDLYQTLSFKVLRACLNHWFKRNKEIDIVSDERFMRANLVFDGVQVKAKKSGKGTVRNTSSDCVTTATRLQSRSDIAPNLSMLH